MPEKEKNDKEIQIRLKTELKDYSVEDVPFSVPFSIDPSGLNTLVKGLLHNCDKVPEFDWLCFSDIVRGKLSEHLADKEDISTESTLVLEYVEKCEAPRPENTANHDDWVSACRVNGDLVLSGCYDNTVNIWTLSGEKKLVIPSHGGPVKAVDWIERTESGATFVSASHDQKLNIYTWNEETNSIENLNTCRGHERSVECVSVSPNKKHFVSGSFDNTVKVWGARPSTEDDNDGGTDAKKPRGGAGRPVTRTPIQTLGETTSAFIFSVCLAVAHGFVVPHGPVRSTPVGCRPAAAAPLLPAQQLLSSRVAPRSTAAPVMGLFGLGAPELAIIGGVALMILGPDQLKKLAKDVGKVSAELKQVPEEFNKGVEAGAAELEAKKATLTSDADAGAKTEEEKKA